MLTPRLKLIYEKIVGKTVADIGTDHAYIPIELMKSGKCEKVIASDIRKGPCEIAKSHIKNEGLNIEVRLGGGLSVLEPYEAEDIIIAGMGGKLICTILEEHFDTAKNSRLILQPMNGQFELRKYLAQKGIKVESEDIAVEGFKVYNVIVCSDCSEPLKYEKEMDFHIPSCLKGHKHYEKLKAKKVREFSKIISGYEKSKAIKDKDRLQQYKELLALLKTGED